MFALGDFIAVNSPDMTVGGRIFLLSFAVWPVFLFFWVKSVRVTFHTDGISYHSLFGEKEIRWDALERFEYGAVKQSVNFIPVGTYYHIKLVGTEGKKLRLGNRVASPGKVATKIIEQSHPSFFANRGALQRRSGVGFWRHPRDPTGRSQDQEVFRRL